MIEDNDDPKHGEIHPPQQLYGSSLETVNLSKLTGKTTNTFDQCQEASFQGFLLAPQRPVYDVTTCIIGLQPSTFVTLCCCKLNLEFINNCKQQQHI